MTDRWNVHYHRRTRIYPSHILRVFRPLNGGIGIVVWRHEVSLTRGCAPSPMRDEPAPSPDDPHGACSRALVGMAVERDKAQSASAASERAYRETRAIADDNLRRLLDCREVVRSLTAERDASSTAHAALVAGIETGLRESACAECDHDRCATYRSAASWVRDYAALDHHAPTTGATP